MNSIYLSLEDIEKDIIKLVTASDFEKLTDSEKDVYYAKCFEIIIKSFNSIGLGSKINIYDMYDVIDTYFDDENVYPDFDQRIDDFFRDFVPGYLQEILDGLNNGAIADETLCENIDEVVDCAIFSDFPNLKVMPIYEEIFSKIVSQNKNLIKFYRGDNDKIYEIMLSEGYETIDGIIEKIKGLSFNKKINIYTILLKYNYDDVIKSDFCNLYVEDIISNLIHNNDYDNETFIKLINDLEPRRLNYVLDSLLEEDLGKINIKIINFIYDTGKISESIYERLFSKLVAKDINVLKDYRGSNIIKKFINLLFDDRYTINENNVNELNEWYTSGNIINEMYSVLFKKVLEKNNNLFHLYKGSDFDIYKTMLQKGLKFDKKLLIHVLLKNDKLSEEDTLIIFKELGIKPFNYLALKAFRGDVNKLIDSMDKIDYFLQLLDINRELFVEFAFGINYNWLDSILDIFDKNQIDDFISVKNYFFKNFYKIDDKSKGVVTIKSIINILKNYMQYPYLCKDLLNSDFSAEQFSKLKLLFGNLDIIKKDNNEDISSKEDLENIENYIFKNFQTAIKYSLDINDIYIMKSVLSKILFNMNSSIVESRLNEYGDIKVLRQLLFNNRHNKDMADSILDMMVYVSMMEDIVDCNDIEKIRSILVKINSSEDIYLLCQRCNMMFREFDLKMDALYAKEMNANLTYLKDIPDDLIDTMMTEKYKVKTIDLKDRKYCLLEHVKSDNETVDELVNGKANGNKLFISLSLGSNRNQRLYTHGGSIIFGYSVLSNDLFIKSSISNMGSNGFLRQFSYEIDTKNMSLRQRGALETSSAIEEVNSEILCYRGGLKPDCIILPNGRVPTQEELEIARKYNLSFVKIQKLETTIDNPKDISDVTINDNNHQLGENKTNYEQFSILRNAIHKADTHKVRRIAIFTDSHGLFEPTLAILEDARRNGITEIYSLGDNIGTGPNPREVMDLLEIYGVKSLKGNHELYATEGVYSYKKHLDYTESFNSALRNSVWTKGKLTSEQIERIKALPENMVIEIGGKKVMLSHYIRDYNTNAKIEIPKEIDEVFQGHVHFKGKDGKVNTLQGAGIGGNVATASYIILTEKSEGGYDVTERHVNYDSKSSHYDIMESDMNEEDKDKIDRWIGGRLR